MAEIRVNKIEAARRQIDVAVRLLFSNDDPVAIHTLASAGFRILRDVSEKTEAAKTHHLIKKSVMPGKEKELWRGINKAANFFKHADSDADQVLEGVQEEANEFALVGATFYYQDLGYSLTPEMNALQIWFGYLHPDIVRMGDPLELDVIRQNAELLSSKPRSEQLALGKQILDLAYQTRRDT